MLSKRGNKAWGQKKQDNEWPDFLICLEKPQNLQKLQRPGCGVCGGRDPVGMAGCHRGSQSRSTLRRSSWAGRCPKRALAHPQSRPGWGDHSSQRTSGSRAVVQRSRPTCPGRPYERLVWGTHSSPAFLRFCLFQSDFCASSTALVHAGLCIHQEAAVVSLGPMLSALRSYQVQTLSAH